jgi:hypothetical protein
MVARWPCGTFFCPFVVANFFFKSGETLHTEHFVDNGRDGLGQAPLQAGNIAALFWSRRCALQSTAPAFTFARICST